MGIAKRSRSPPQAAPVEGWDVLADAELAASESGDEAPRDDGAECHGALCPLAECLALGRGQQDIRRYLRPLSAPLEDEADPTGAAAERPDWRLTSTEAASHAADEAAAVAMGLSFGLAEDKAELMDAALELPGELALAEAASHAEDEAAAVAMGLSLGLAEDEAELMDAALDLPGELAPAEAASHAEDEAAAVAMGLSLGLAEEAEEPPCDLGDLEEDWGDHEPRERALFEAEEAAAESLGLPLGLEAAAKPMGPPPGLAGVPAEAAGARGGEAATPVKRRRRQASEDEPTPPCGAKRGRVAPADAPAAGAPTEAPKGAASEGPGACLGRARKLQRRGLV